MSPAEVLLSSASKHGHVNARISMSMGASRTGGRRTLTAMGMPLSEAPSGGITGAGLYLVQSEAIPRRSLR